MRNLLLILAVFFGIQSFAQTQLQKDDKILQEYFKKNNLSPKKTPSGMYYVITKAGSGPNAKNGQKVSMGYNGKFLNGQKFDGNINDAGKVTRPFEFTLGTGQVIRGWDEGVSFLNKGCKAILFLPSDLGYGANGIGPIPPNSVLMFDVQVEDIH